MLDRLASGGRELIGVQHGRGFAVV
jgi:hypothetical protein